MSLPAAVTQYTRPMKPTQKFEGHSGMVYGVSQLRSGQRIMTCSTDGSLRIWNMLNGKQIARWENEGSSQILAISLSPDKKKVVSGSDNGVVRLWNIDTGKVIAKWTGHTGKVTSLCWNKGAERVVSGSWDGTARVWDVESGRTVVEIKTGLSQVRAAIYSPDTTKIATGGQSAAIEIWDANTGKLVANLKGHTSGVRCLAWTTNGRTLVSGSWDHSIRMWNTALTTWQQIAVLTGHTEVVFGIAISPNGQILASASWDNTVRLWNLENSQPIGSPLQHPADVNCVSFSTDGHLLATGCDDGNAYTWDISGITDDDKPFINANATRRLRQPHEHSRRLHPAFFNDTPQHPDFSIRRPRFPPSLRHDTSPRSRLLDRTRNLFFLTPSRQNAEGVELRGNGSEIIDVPVGRGKYMNYAAGQLPERREKEKARRMKNARNAKNAGNASAGQMTRQSAGVPQASSSSDPHTALSTISTTSAVAVTPVIMHNSPGMSENYSSSGPHAAVSPAVAAATSAISLQDAIIPWAGWWTRFRRFIGCMPV